MEDIFQQQVIQQGNQNVGDSIGVNPDQQVNDVEKANALGIRVDEYKANRDSYDARASQAAMNLYAAGPVLQKFYANREKQLLIANDLPEFDRLDFTEKIFSTFKQGWNQFGVNTEMRDAIDASRRFQDPLGTFMAENQGEGELENAWEKIPDRIRSAFSDKLQLESLQQLQKEAEDLAVANRFAQVVKPPKVLERWENAKGWDQASEAFWSDPLSMIGYVGGTSLAQQFVPMLMSMPAFAFSPLAGAVASGGGSAYTEYLSSFAEKMGESGVDLTDSNAIVQFLLDPTKFAEAQEFASQRAGGVGLWDAVGGLVAATPFRFVAGTRGFGRQVSRALRGRHTAPLQRTKIARAIDRIADNSPIMSKFDAILSQTTVGGFLGGVGEFTAQMASGQETDWGDIFLEAIGEFFTMPAEIASAQTGIAMAKAKEYRHVQVAKKASKLVTDLAKVASISNLRGRKPEVFKEVIKEMGENSQLKEVYVRGSDISNELGQSILEVVPELGAALEEARETGGDLVIPMDILLTSLSEDSKIINGLKDHIRISQDGMSVKEADEWVKQNRDFMNRHFDAVFNAQIQKEEYRKELQTAVDPMAAQLNVALRETMAKAYTEAGVMTEADALKRADEVTTHSMRLFGAQLARISALAGMTPSQFTQRYPNQIRYIYEATQEQALSQGEAQALTESFEKLQRVVDFVLGGEPVATLTGQEFQKSEESLIDRVTRFFAEEYQSKAISPELGEIILNRQSVKDSLAHGIGSKKAAAFAAVRDVIEKGRVFDYQINWKGRNYDTFVIAAPITIGGDGYICEVIVKKNKDSTQFYLHEVNLNSDVAATLQDPNREGQQQPPARPVRSILVQKYLDHKEKIKSLQNKEAELNQDAIAMRSSAEKIRKEFQGTDKWLKAPNGKPSNLTEQQWCTVRTPEFKRWFGDWENDPENASKIVDENGEPLVVYHGTTKAGFDVFDTRGRGKTEGTGAFFTDVERVAGTYSDNAVNVTLDEDFGFISEGRGNYPVFLNIRTPYVFEANGRNWDNLSVINVVDEEWSDYHDTNQNGEPFRSEDEAWDYIENVLADPDHQEWQVQTEGAETTDDVVRAVREKDEDMLFDLDYDAEYDGVIFNSITDHGPFYYGSRLEYEGRTFVVFEPEQIKSAELNTGEFNPYNPSILHQSAWHGSPYVFDMFSLEHIGSGEGAQAHGWGLYFAKQRDVAAHYRMRLSRNKDEDYEILVDGMPATDYYRAIERKAERAWIAKARDMWYERLAVFEDYLAYEDASRVEENWQEYGEESYSKQAYEWFINEVKPKINQPGRLFKVEIPGNEVLLDEQLAFKDQPEAVKKAIRQLEKDLKVDWASAENHIKAEVDNDINMSVSKGWLNEEQAAQKRKALTMYAKMLADGYSAEDAHSAIKHNYGENTVGYYEGISVMQRVYKTMGISDFGSIAPEDAFVVTDDMDGADIYMKLSRRLGSSKAASLALNDLGIKGITYEGESDERCFVIFDDQAIQILEFYQAQMNEKRRAAYNPSEGVTRLFESADESSFVHESAHYWLNTLALICGDIVDIPADQRTAGEQELLEILDGFLKWAGLDAKQQQPKSKLAQKFFSDLGLAGDTPEARVRIWNSMTLDQQRQFHEQFARGYEAYLRNGKAPTSALGRAFAKFKEWLLEIYKDASELQVEMTPEVYALYDRLFMSEMETKAETEGRHIIPLFTSAKAAGMSDDEFSKLKQAYDAVTEAIGASIRAGRERNHKLLASRVEREKLGLEKEFNDMIAQARKELEKSAVYRAWSMLDEGTTIEGIDFHSKLSRAEVTKILKGDTALLDALEAKGFLTDEASNFVPAKILADFAGARSAKQLVTDLAEMQPIEEEATEIAETRFMQQYGNLPNDEGLTRSAVVAVAAHDPSYSKALAYEYNALAKLTGSAKLAREGASKFAREKIGQQQISQLRPIAHARAEARAGKDAERAFRSGDLVGAAIHKRNQVVQHHIAKAGYDALTEVQRGIKFVKKALKSKSIYGSYMVQIENLAARFGLANIEYNRGSKQLGEFLTEEEFPAGMVAEFLETDDTAMPYEQMTVEDFRELMDAIKMLVKTGREKNTVIIEGRRQSLKETVDSVKVSIEDNATKQKRDFETRYQKSKPGDLTKQSVLRFIHSHIKIASWARIMDGDKLGAMWNTFIRRANECGDRETELRHQLTKQLQEIFDPLLRQGGMHSEEVVLPTANRPLTRQERIAFALNWGNDGNRQRLKDGFGISDQEADVILRSLSESEWRAVEQIWAVFEGLRPEMEALEVRLYGRPPRWIEYSPFDVVTSEGKQITVSGGYYPAVYDFDADERANKHEDMKQAESLMHKAARAVATDRSHMKKRAAHVERPISLLLSNCFDALNNEVHDLCWREYVIDAQRLLKGGVSEQIRGYYGADVARDFQKWLQDVALGEQRPREGCEAWLSTLRQGVGLAGLGFNVVSAISQFTGLISTTSRLGAYTGVGLGQYVRNPIEATRQVCEQSLFMKNRGLTRFRELNEVNNRIRNSENRIEQTMDWMRTGGYWMLLKIQQIVDTITWLGAYQRAIDNNHTVEEARAMADQEVIDTQGSGMIKDQASVERGGPAMKMLTVFYSFMNTAFNLNATAFLGDRNRYRATAKILTMTMVMPVVEGMLRGALPVDISDDDDDDDITADMLKQAAQVINFNAGMLLGVRELATLSNVVSGEPIWSYQGPGGFRLIGDIYKATQQVAQGEYDAALVKSLVNLGGSMFGLPSAQINRVVSSEAEDLEGADYARGVLFGVKNQ